MRWSPAQYSRFEAERNRPVVDLLAHIPTRPVRVAADIGCGPGNSTGLLRQRFPDARIIGLDNSPDMIEAARRRLPGLRFEVADITAWQDPGPFDIILANASLQWVPDHAGLLPKLIGKLAPGGSFAMQVPDNLGEPSHRLMRRIAMEARWAGRLDEGWSLWANRHPADYYHTLLSGACASVDIWRTTYYHPLAGGPSAIVEWFLGSALRPFLAPLDEEERSAFLAAYGAEIGKAYPPLPNGSVLLPFPRLFLLATR